MPKESGDSHVTRRHIIARSREKGTYVLAAAPKYELLAHYMFASDASVFNATPAVSRGQLLLRSDKYLYCLGER